ncbi:MAG: glycoside hydrolase family 127 protein [Alkalibacterium sp.]|nr:glycoside hydrolase family 127 protein [Alkalibacterium sp.]
MKTDIVINDQFWKRYTDLIRKEMIPYQWDVLHDQAGISIDKERDDQSIPSEKSNAIENLKIAAGKKEGNHYGWLFQDSDVYKWLESAANSYKLTPDESLLNMMDELVLLIEEAQEDDGYLSTYYQIERPDLRFRRLFESHELYCAGHLIEASVAHYKATGSKRLIHVSEKFVECIQTHFGPEAGKINGADGHQEIELALIKLYEVTGEESYVDLSSWFLTIRGQDPDFYTKQLIENKKKGLSTGEIPSINLKYHQAHKPVLKQEEAVGHAVRLVYMAAAMAEVAAIHKDQKMFKAARKIWDNIVKKRLYITGGIGSTVHGEAFTFDYDLPNDTMYCETCASIGLLFFAKAMMKNHVDVDYAEIMEKTLYNTIISGMALDGKHFFYVNPLEVDPESSRKNPGKSHVKATRPSWFGCACCPPNVARTLTSLNQYITDVVDNNLYIHLYQNFEGSFELERQSVSINMTTDLPYDGKTKLTVYGVQKPFNLRLRMPSWSSNIECKTKDLNFEEINGYLSVTIDSDKTIEIDFKLPVIEWISNPLVKNNLNKVAVQRGPFVYCLEEADNGAHLHLLSVTQKGVPENKSDSTLGKFIALKAKAERKIIDKSWQNNLYQSDAVDKIEETEVTFIPYHLWANRSLGEMRVWVNKK